MADNGLGGFLAPALEPHTHLLGFDASSNDFEGPLPKEFARMSKLQSLDLGSNRLEGELPPEYGGGTSSNDNDNGSRDSGRGRASSRGSDTGNLWGESNSARPSSRSRGRSQEPEPAGLGGSLQRLLLPLNRLYGPIPDSYSTLT